MVFTNGRVAGKLFLELASLASSKNDVVPNVAVYKIPGCRDVFDRYFSFSPSNHDGCHQGQENTASPVTLAAIPCVIMVEMELDLPVTSVSHISESV